ncbi:hypothetical protein MMARV_C020P3 [viral metagenome]|uniref:Uncharacterized protein n=1 Tax=viral metagenome TaxID=1070528 RepID=A0A6L2ZK71_9ZZZZ
MASFFNPLVPLYSNYTWDGLIPQSTIISDDVFEFYFTKDSTRADIQKLRVRVFPYCCSDSTSFQCSDGSMNRGIFFLYIVALEYRDGMEYKIATSNVIYDYDLKAFYCVDRNQQSRCGANYDSLVHDIDLYTTILGWVSTSIELTGDITQTKFYRLIITDENVCEISSPKIDYGKLLYSSLQLFT